VSSTANDYVLLADYVRQDNRFIHVMAAGVDTICVPSLPWIQPLGIAVRLSFGPTDQPRRPTNPDRIHHRPRRACAGQIR
jgi:hypothetical protein